MGIGNPFIFDDPYDDWYDDDEEDFTPLQPKECDHVWIWYHGLQKSFEFCEKCDIKKEDAT